jgi:hypothetical protein
MVINRSKVFVYKLLIVFDAPFQLKESGILNLPKGQLFEYPMASPFPMIFQTLIAGLSLTLWLESRCRRAVETQSKENKW